MENKSNDEKLSVKVDKETADGLKLIGSRDIPVDAFSTISPMQLFSKPVEAPDIYKRIAKNYENYSEDEFEEYVKGLDDNIESVTTCDVSSIEEGSQKGLVITVKGTDVVLVASDLQNIVDYLNNQPIYDEDE